MSHDTYRKAGMKLKWKRGLVGLRHLMCPLCGSQPVATLYRDEREKIWRGSIAGCLLLPERPGRRRNSEVVVTDRSLKKARAAVMPLVEEYIHHRLGIYQDGHDRWLRSSHD